jgi:nitrite reductase (NADH) small subunit
MTNWIKIGSLSDIPVLGSRVVRTAAGNIAVFRTGDDEVFALDDRCPHKGGPLSQGIVYGEAVACPLHNWNIDLHTGCAVTPDQGCTQRFDTRVDAGTVYIDLDGGARATADPRPVEQVGADD